LLALCVSLIGMGLLVLGDGRLPPASAVTAGLGALSATSTA